MSMVRKQVYITREQDALLKGLAAANGRTEAEIIRSALEGLAPDPDEVGDRAPGRIREAPVMDRYAKEDMGNTSGLALDRKLADEAWQKELAFMKSLDASMVKGRENAWKFDREELYEERLAKILRRH